MQTTDTVILGSEYEAVRAVSVELLGELERRVSADELDLPSLPEVALKIRNALADDAVPVDEIVRLVGSEPVLAARLLKTANSALFSRGSKPIGTLKMAVTRLGYRMVRNVALSVAAQQVFIGYATKQLKRHLTDVWKHSVHVAALAHMLAKVKTELDPDEAFLAGLLHEVGKLYILMRAKDHPALLGSDAFQSVLADWHTRIGRLVIEAWDLPADLAAAVGEHEHRGLEAVAPAALTDVVAVANFLAEASANGRIDGLYDRCPDFGALSLEQPTFDWLLRAGKVDIHLLTVAFGT